eukprot:712985-Rhodomonas_salina.1
MVSSSGGGSSSPCSCRNPKSSGDVGAESDGCGRDVRDVLRPGAAPLRVRCRIHPIATRVAQCRLLVTSATAALRSQASLATILPSDGWSLPS